MWTFLLLTMWILIPQLLLAQTNKTSGQKVIELNGVRGVFVPQPFYRTLIIDQRKGFSYYTNWKITEVQLIKKDSINIGLKETADRIQMNWDLEKQNYNDQVEVNQTLEIIAETLEESNVKLQKKVKFIPWIIAGSFITGTTVGLLTK